MKLAPLLVLALVPLAALAAGKPPAEAAEEPPPCSLNEDALRPQFAAKLPKGFKLLSTKKDKKARTFTQELQLPEGTKATIRVGGCEHLAVTIDLHNPSLTTKTVGAEVVAVAKRVLPQLPVQKEAAADPKLFLKAIDEANIMMLPNQLPCGDATCQLSLEPEEVKGAKGAKAPKAKPGKKEAEPEAPVKAPLEEAPAFIRLSYDFAL